MLKAALLLILLSLALLLFMGSVGLALKIGSSLYEQIRRGRGAPYGGGNGSRTPGAARTLFRADMQAALREALPAFSFDNAAAMSCDIALIATDRDGQIVSFNRGAECLLGYQAGGVNGRMAIEFLFSEDEVTAHTDLLQQSKGQTLTAFEALVFEALDGTVEDRKWSWIRRNAQPVSVILTITALRNGNGVAEGFLFMAHRANGSGN